MHTFIKKLSDHNKVILFIVGIIFFSVIAKFGWDKLHYGFNFTDEGYHMTESWRLAAGDDFIKNNVFGGLMNYTLINQLIFKTYPDITLLDFRRIQYMLAILSLIIFGVALFKISGQYAWLPFIFSLFAFTGFDANGMIPNLYYHTYPHLFLALHLSFFLFGLQAQKLFIKKIYYVLAGFCLWGISMSLLYLSVIILSPFITFFLVRKFNYKSYIFTFTDLLYVLSPFVLCWSVFILIYNKLYIISVISSVKLVLSLNSFSSGLISLNWGAIQYIAISLAFLSAFFVLIKKRLNFCLVIAACCILSILLFTIITTFGFGLLNHYQSWKPMWFASFLIAFSIFFWIYTIARYRFNKNFSREDELAVILMVPFTICALTTSIFSTVGLMSVSESSIPAVAAIAYTFMSAMKPCKYKQARIILILLLLLGNFYYANIWFDWRFTFYDVPPDQMTATINDGFGKGIKTNVVYSKLYEWIKKNAEEYTHKNDFMLSYVLFPMTHMITKLRPSLDESYLFFNWPRSICEKGIEVMKKKGRNPKIAFVSEREIMLLPISLDKGTFHWNAKQFYFPWSMDPFSIYVKKNMKQVSAFKITDDFIIRCYVDFNLLKK